MNKLELMPQVNLPGVGELCYRFGVGIEKALAMQKQMEQEVVFRNDVYQVTVSGSFPTRKEGWPDMCHLSILRLDGQPIEGWGDLQEIKNILIGPEFEAIEIYPAESRLVNCGNNRHLWVFLSEEFRIPMGWTERMVR